MTPKWQKLDRSQNSTLFYLFYYMNIRNISSSRLYDRLYSRLYNRLQSVNGLLVSCSHLIIDFTLSLRTHSQTSLFAYTTYADNMALPAFARRTPLLQQPIGISCPPGPQKAASPCWDRETDGRTPYRFIDHAPHTMPAIPETSRLRQACEQLA